MPKTVKVKATTRNGKVVKAHTRTVKDATKNPMYPKTGGLRELSKAWQTANKKLYMSERTPEPGSSAEAKVTNAYEKKKLALMKKNKINRKHAASADVKLHG